MGCVADRKSVGCRCIRSIGHEREIEGSVRRPIHDRIVVPDAAPILSTRMSCMRSGCAHSSHFVLVSKANTPICEWSVAPENEGANSMACRSGSGSGSGVGCGSVFVLEAGSSTGSSSPHPWGKVRATSAVSKKNLLRKSCVVIAETELLWIT